MCVTDKKDILRTGIKRRQSTPNQKTKQKLKKSPERNLKNATSMWMAFFLHPPMLCHSAAAGRRLLQCFVQCRASANTLSRKDRALPNSTPGPPRLGVRAKRSFCQKVNTAGTRGIDQARRGAVTSCYCGGPWYTTPTPHLFWRFFSISKMYPFWWSVDTSFNLLLHH